MMASQDDITNALVANGIIPDVLPAGTIVPRKLKISFPTITLTTPGQTIDREEAQLRPLVYVTPPPEEDLMRSIYTLIMVDPDLTIRHDTRFGQVRHWLVDSCSVNSSGEVLDLEATIRSPWIGPAPMPVYGTWKPHPARYTFILCKNKCFSAQDNQDLKISESKQYTGLKTDFGKPSQDLFDRWKFNTAQFIQDNQLEVVAATYMLVEGTLKSGAGNVGLMATAVGHKIGEIGH